MSTPDAETMDERPTKGRESAALRRDRDEDDLSTAEWFNANTNGSACKVRVDRKAPRTGRNGENCGGVLETIEDVPDDLEEYIRDMWGGGTFQLQLQLPKDTGGWRYGKARQLRLAGEPKMHGRPLTEAAPAAAVPIENENVSATAIGVATKFADKERERADRLEREIAAGRQQGGLGDLAQIDLLMRPLRDELAAMRATNERLQQDLLAATTRQPPRDEFRDKLLAKAVDDENAKLQAQADRYERRLDQLRDNHTSELRQLREGHAQDVKRLEDRHDRALADLQKQMERTNADLTKAHERELKQVERSQSGESAALKIAYETQIASLKGEVARLQAQIAESKGEIGALRDKKDKTPVELLKEMATIKEQMDALTGGGGGGDENKPWYAQVLDAFGNSEVGIKIVERLTGGGDGDVGDADAGDDAPPAAAPAQHPQPRMLPPIGRPFKNPDDGKWYIHRGEALFEGPYEEAQVRQMLAATKQRARQQIAQPGAGGAPPAPAPQLAQRRRRDLPGAPAAAGAAAAAPAAGAPAPTPAPAPALAAPAAQGGAAPATPPPESKEVAMAVAYLENALGRGVKPEQVATSAAKLIPPATVQWIKEVGIDRFLQAVAAEKPSSPLVTQHGRTWIRQVAQLLFRAQT